MLTAGRVRASARQGCSKAPFPAMRMISGVRRASGPRHQRGAQYAVRVLAATASEAAQAAASSAVASGTVALRKAAAQAAYKGTQVLVAGGQGLIAVRVIKELLLAGFKVTAAVSDIAAAKAVADFAKRYELIDRSAVANLKLVEVDPEDEASIKALPKRAKVIVVEGDVEGKNKITAKEVAAVLSLAKAISSSQVVLVSTAAAASGGGGGFSFFGGGGGAKPGKSNDRLGKTEELVADSGLPYAVVRAYGTDKTEDDYALADSTPQVTGLGTVPTSAVASKAQVASVVVELLKAASAPSSVVLELAGASEDQPPLPDAIALVLAEAKAADDEKAAAAAAAAKASGGFFGFGAPSKASPKEEEEEEEAPSPGTRSTRRLAVAAMAAKAKQQAKAQPEPEPEEPKQAGGLFGFLGTGKVKVGAKEEDAPPAKASGTGKVRVGTTSSRSQPTSAAPRPGMASSRGTAAVRGAPPARGTASSRAAPPPAPVKGGTAQKKAGPSFSVSGRKGDDFVYIE